MSPLCIVEQYVLDFIRSFELLRPFVDLRHKLLWLRDWRLHCDLTFVVIRSGRELRLLCPHWIVKSIMHRYISRITTIWTTIRASWIIIECSPSQINCSLPDMGFKSKILIHLSDFNCMLVPRNTYRFQYLLILNESLRAAYTGCFTIFPVAISKAMAWGRWVHEYDTLTSNNLAMVFQLVPLGFFYFLFLGLSSFMITKESIKDRSYFRLVHR